MRYIKSTSYLLTYLLPFSFSFRCLSMPLAWVQRWTVMRKKCPEEPENVFLFRRLGPKICEDRTVLTRRPCVRYPLRGCHSNGPPMKASVKLRDAGLGPIGFAPDGVDAIEILSWSTFGRPLSPVHFNHCR